ncbi:MAG: hypothetical protein HeimC3_07520 [Candidatus Heimdallarchaeota archaeon LC_3]|nr:MAG: hypothetical protein HeimC3_07520 [Candidatus Heimdallarchaeota archaeon LC_3]
MINNIINVQDSIMNKLMDNENKFNLSQDKWSYLGSLLSLFGAKQEKDKIVLEWDSPDVTQFESLTKIMSKLINRNLFGSYSRARKRWLIRVV